MTEDNGREVPNCNPSGLQNASRASLRGSRLFQPTTRVTRADRVRLDDRGRVHELRVRTHARAPPRIGEFRECPRAARSPHSNLRAGKSGHLYTWDRIETRPDLKHGLRFRSRPVFFPARLARTRTDPPPRATSSKRPTASRRARESPRPTARDARFAPSPTRRGTLGSSRTTFRSRDRGSAGWRPHRPQARR